MAVAIDEWTVYAPDALVRCGTPLDEDAIKIVDPMIIVEVRSPSTQARDAGAKLADYVRLPSLRHYLLVDTRTRAIIQHRIEADGRIETRIVRDDTLNLAPPDIRIRIADVFP